MCVRSGLSIESTVSRIRCSRRFFFLFSPSNAFKLSCICIYRCMCFDCKHVCALRVHVSLCVLELNRTRFGRNYQAPNWVTMEYCFEYFVACSMAILALLFYFHFHFHSIEANVYLIPSTIPIHSTCSPLSFFSPGNKFSVIKQHLYYIYESKPMEQQNVVRGKGLWTIE